MPFARGARIEAEAGPDVDPPRIILFVDWHAYPDGALQEPLRFHAQFRRENPCQAFGRNYLLMDAVGRGYLLGFNYGVAVRDDRARWSHAGAENIYVANETGAPEGTFAYLRGGGGEDTFGASYGGVLHQPSSHLDQGVPYYAQEDLGPAFARHTLAAYRFFASDAIPFSAPSTFASAPWPTTSAAPPIGTRNLPTVPSLSCPAGTSCRSARNCPTPAPERRTPRRAGWFTARCTPARSRRWRPPRTRAICARSSRTPATRPIHLGGIKTGTSLAGAGRGHSRLR